MRFDNTFDSLEDNVRLEFIVFAIENQQICVKIMNLLNSINFKSRNWKKTYPTL